MTFLKFLANDIWRMLTDDSRTVAQQVISGLLMVCELFVFLLSIIAIKAIFMVIANRNDIELIYVEDYSVFLIVWLFLVYAYARDWARKVKQKPSKISLEKRFILDLNSRN